MRVVALTFHDVVGDGQAPSAVSDGFYRIPAVEFEALLSRLRKVGYQTVASKEFRAWQRGQGELPRRTVVLTFDDGYAGHLDVVAPLLLRHRFTGVFFVVPQLIGQPGYLTWERLKRLVFLGMEIGSHGLSHTPMTRLSPMALADELVRSKRMLEERLGIEVRAIAAPGGFWNQTVVEAVRQAGYDSAWVSTIGTNGTETHPLSLRRIAVRPPVSVDRVIAMVEGQSASLWLAARQQFLIRLLKRILGVYRYEQIKRRLVPDA